MKAEQLRDTAIAIGLAAGAIGVVRGVDDIRALAWERLGVPIVAPVSRGVDPKLIHSDTGLIKFGNGVLILVYSGVAIGAAAYLLGEIEDEKAQEAEGGL